MTNQPNKIIVRDLDLGVLTSYKTQGEALLAAILDLQLTGGGILWLHRTDCAGTQGDLGCECDPVDIYIDPTERPN